MKYLSRGMRKALVLSPAASHPQDFGNRRRVYQTCARLKEWGYEIHFLLYPMEPDWMARVQDSARDMARAWHSFQIIPSTRPIPLQSPALAYHHTIDEWWDPAIGTHLAWLFAREHFDVFVVNYVFLSKAFEFADNRAVRVLETHDRFAERKELLTALGARLESFYTTEAEEKIGLDRSDIVVAIKESEAAFYRKLTSRHVVTVPFWSDQSHFAQTKGESGPKNMLRVGFIGALNTVNEANMVAYLREFERNPHIAAAPLQLEIAGDVCFHLGFAHPQLKLLGRVASLEAYYRGVDVIVVPMTHSTGLKIKTGEALAFGKAVVATSDGFDGFPAMDAFHCLDSFDAVCRALAVLARDRDRLNELERRSRISARLASRGTELGYKRLAAAISRFLPAVLFLTDRAVLGEGDASTERIAQWCEVCSGLATTLLVYLGEAEPVQPRPELARTDVLAVGGSANGADAVVAAWEKLGRRHTITEVVISAAGEVANSAWLAASQRCKHVTLDTWHPELAAIAEKHSQVPAPDYWTTHDVSGVEILCSRTAFVNRPRVLKVWQGRAEGVLSVLCGPDETDREAVTLLLPKLAEPNGHGVLTLAAARGAVLEPGFLAALAGLKMPEIILAIGSDERALSICRAIAAVFRLVVVHLASIRFPLALTHADGTLSLCENYRDMESCFDIAMLARSACTDGADTGWSTYTTRLRRRISKRRNELS